MRVRRDERHRLVTSRLREPFAAWLGRALAEKGIRRPALAELLGVDPSTVARWLAGETRPRLRTVRRLAAALGFEVRLVCKLAGYTANPAGTEELSAQELELLAFFRRLSQPQKRIVLAAARGGIGE
jgi:transcriptional regulator with XRE-family HTH domain